MGFKQICMFEWPVLMAGKLSFVIGGHRTSLNDRVLGMVYAKHKEIAQWSSGKIMATA